MTAARAPRRRNTTRLLVLDPDSGAMRDRRIGELPDVLREDDLLIVNDAATLPASLSGTTSQGDEIELRLIASVGSRRWRAVTLGTGDWRTPTEDRGAPPPLTAGDRIRVGDDLQATVEEVHARSPRLVDVSFNREGAGLWHALYSRGRPVQYSHLSEDVPLEQFQTVYAGRPWSVEMPSAGRPLSWAVLLECRRRGIRLASITHAAGLSSTGDPVIDAALPLPERYEIPRRTVEAIQEARASRGRVIAVGTSVVRALEGCVVAHGGLRAAAGVTDLVITPGFRPRVVDGILTGVHDPTETHFDLLHAFASRECLTAAHALATRLGYRGHEFGDAMLIAGRAEAAFLLSPQRETESPGRHRNTRSERLQSTESRRPR